MSCCFRSISTGSFRFCGSSAALAPPRMRESPSTICSRSCGTEDLRRARSSSERATPPTDCFTSRRARLRSASSASRSARSTSSNSRPDTLVQDRKPPAYRFLLQHTAGPYMCAKCGSRPAVRAVECCLRAPQTKLGSKVLRVDGKRQDILFDLLPTARHMAMLADSQTTGGLQVEAIRDAARSRGVEFSIHEVQRSEEIASAVEAAKASGAAALTFSIPADLLHRSNPPGSATCGHWPRFIRSPHRRPFAGLLCRFSARGHRSEIMLGVLVVVFCPDYIAGLGLSLG